MSLSEVVKKYNTKLSTKKGEENVLREQHRELKMIEKKLITKYQAIEKAKVIAQIVAKQTQKKIEYHINGLVTSGLEAVFPDPYSFHLKFVTRRNKTEADMVFKKYGKETDDILNSGGGGVADIASYLLSIAVFSINPSRPIFIRDENFKFLHNTVFQEKASLMIKKMSDKFNIQMILISDQPSLYKYADKIINVKIVNGVSYADDSLLKNY